MAFPVPGSERFANTARTGAEVRATVPPSLPLHTVGDDRLLDLDPLTYEVIRHRLWAITTEMGEALKRMSGSVVVTDCNDIGTAIMDEVGDAVQVGMYNTLLVTSMDMAVKWTLENRASNPGIKPGDMFICTDPWIGGGLHQNDVALFAPVFWEGELFAWTAATAHQVDLGGVAPGSWTIQGQDVFWESLPLPPITIVENGRIRSDVEDSYLRRARMPALVALDLRAKVGANNVAQEGISSLIRRYGPDTVKAVMKAMMNDADSRLRGKLKALPDGAWRSVAYQDSARAGDENLYKIVLEMRKEDDRLTFDFTGTDPQVDGLINCTFAGLRGGVICSVLALLCGDIPWAPGGLSRSIEIISEPGTINNCTFPHGVGKAPVASAWATSSAVVECLAGMLDRDPESSKDILGVSCGTWDLAILAGIDQNENPFVTLVCDPMAGGMGARTERDGVDTGGLMCIPMGRIADVEMNEFAFPMLYLWRKESIDSGGPGRFRGGVGASSCFVPHDTSVGGIHLVASQSGKALPQASGLSGGYPGSSALDVIVRGSDVTSTFLAGGIPTDLEQLGGQVEVLAAHHETDLGMNDVYYTEWQSGGGYGDPLLRDPALVAIDVGEGKVSSQAANDIYGVVIASGNADLEQTTSRRNTLRRQRAGIEG